MKVVFAMFVAAAMTFGVSTAYAGKACCASKQAAKSEVKDCGSCDYAKGSAECKEACAAAKADSETKMCGCGHEKGSEACKKACAKS